MPTQRPRARMPLPAVPPRPDIQGLRAIAVLLVVVSHAGLSSLPGGYIGVDVFFVVSGFLITSILLHEATERGSISLMGFYAKRARRILPAATVTLAATAAAATLIMPIIRSEKVLDDVAWAAVFAANIRFGQEDTDYFAVGGPESPIQHFWSLAVEEQFYLVWPALLIVLLIAGARRTPEVVAGRVFRAGLLVTVLVAISFVWSVMRTPEDPTGSYFSTATRSWELGAGALLAFGGRVLPRLSKRTRAVLAWSGLAMVAVAAATFTDRTPVPGYHIALPVAGTVFLLAAGTGVAAEAGPLVSRLLGRQPLRWIGDVSYGFYLWHWPFLILGQAYAGHRLSLTTKLLLSGGALVAAWLSYRLLENPIRHATTLRRRPRFALALWPVAICSLLLVNTSAHAYIKHERRSVEIAAAKVDVSDLPRSERAPRNGNEVHDAVAEAVDRAALNAPQAPPSNLKSSGDGFSRDPECRAAEPDTEHEICPMGDEEGKRTMVAFGDSHAQMWLPALDKIAKRRGYKLLPLVKLGCTPYDVVAWKFSRDDVFTECNEYRPWALDQIRQIKPDVVVVASAPVKKSADEDGEEVLSGDEARKAWRKGVRSIAKKLLKTTSHVRFFAAINRLPWEPADCLSDLDKTAADCTFDASEWVADNNKLIRQAIGPTDARYVGLRGLFCLRGKCPTVIDDRQVYADDDHLASDYARYLADEIEDRLRLPRRR